MVQAWLLITLTALAHATPPDPLWIPGIYDAADRDEVIGLLEDGPPVVASRGWAADGPILLNQRSRAPGPVSARSLLAGYTFRPRSPPTP